MVGGRELVLICMDQGELEERDTVIIEYKARWEFLGGLIKLLHLNEIFSELGFSASPLQGASGRPSNTCACRKK